MKLLHKKQLIRLCSLILMTLMLFTACNNTPNEPVVTTNNTTAAQTTAAPGPDPVPDIVATLKLGETDISEYVIIYESPDDKTALGSYWREEYDAGLVTAKRLAAMIKTKFGVELECKPDTATKTDNEILIGETNRYESITGEVKKLTFDKYYVGTNGTKLVIRGIVPGTTYHALDSLEAYFATTVENEAYVIDKNSTLSGTYHLKNIAILGDSITYGALSTNYTNNGGLYGYAQTFARMNWQECRVTVYATPGVCLRTDLNGFMTIGLWSQFISRSAADKFDLLFVMLGTNDGYTDKKTGDTWDGVWTEEDDASFLQTMDDLVTAANTANPGLKTVIMNCPVYYRTAATHASHYHVNPHTLELQAQGVENLRAKGVDVHLYDMNTYTSEKTPSSMYSDLLHPNDEGHYIMAEGVTAMLQLLLKGETDKYLIN